MFGSIFYVNLIPLTRLINTAKPKAGQSLFTLLFRTACLSTVHIICRVKYSEWFSNFFYLSNTALFAFIV